MKQDNLFDPPPKYQAHSQTSREAAQSIESSTKTLRSSVFSFIACAPSYGATDEEIAAYLGKSGNTLRPRRIELLEMGKIRDSGQTRLTKSGRKATIWKII